MFHCKCLLACMNFLTITFLLEDRTGSGWISACGGNGFAGGGGGRISIDVFSRHDDTEYFIHGMYWAYK